MKLYLILVKVMLLTQVQSGLLQAQWKLEKKEGGIEVYTRPVEGSEYKEFKAEMVLDCSMDAILELLKDADNFYKWLHNCKSSKLLKRIDHTLQYNYTVTELPFPFDNRDMIFKAQFSVSNGIHKISLEGTPNYIQEQTNLVRMKDAKGSWIFTPLDDSKIKVSYQLWVDPGGAIPAWLSNLKVVEIPYESLNNMRMQLAK
ncbi:MAG: START domain-containing protein [Bacteroidota bacterium]|nr:MAG: START domain-containing protein [Bacteroidota bacterium]